MATPAVTTALLIEIRSPYSGDVERIVLSGPRLVGRGASCDVCLPDLRVSRRHALISVTDAGRLAVEDLGSTNGTRVGAQTLRGGVLTMAVPAMIHIEPFALMIRREGEGGDTTLRISSPPSLWVRPHPNGLEINGRAVRAGLQERRLLEVLISRYPESVSHAELAGAIWDGGAWAPYQLQNVVGRCRRSLRAAGIAPADPIEAVRGYGYRLTIDLDSLSSPS